jgi:hypothetical protein
VKQAIARVDHDVRVLARKTGEVKALGLGEALDWAVAGGQGEGVSGQRVPGQSWAKV